MEAPVYVPFLLLFVLLALAAVVGAGGLLIYLAVQVRNLRHRLTDVENTVRRLLEERRPGRLPERGGDATAIQERP